MVKIQNVSYRSDTVKTAIDRENNFSRITFCAYFEAKQ